MVETRQNFKNGTENVLLGLVDLSNRLILTVLYIHLFHQHLNLFVF